MPSSNIVQSLIYSEWGNQHLVGHFRYHNLEVLGNQFRGHSQFLSVCSFVARHKLSIVHTSHEWASGVVVRFALAFCHGGSGWCAC